MSAASPEDFLRQVGEMLVSASTNPNVLRGLGVPDVVRVSPAAYEELKAGGSSPAGFPFGIKVEPDPDLHGERFELGPKPPRPAQPDAGGERADESRDQINGTIHL